MDPAFKRASVIGCDREPVVFGLKLKPFTLGHLFLLERLDSPLITEQGSDGLSFADIGAVVFTCAHETADEAKRAFNKWWFPFFAWIWAKFSKPHWFTHDLKTLQVYLNDSFSSPALRPAKNGGQTCQAPTSWIKLLFAMHVLGMTKQQALNSTVAELNALYATFATWNGTGELVDYDLIDGLWKFAAEQDALKFGGRN